jgi:hypothetical protein
MTREPNLEVCFGLHCVLHELFFETLEHDSQLSKKQFL